MSPSVYFMPLNSNRMRALASVAALRRHYEVLGKGDAPDHTGLIVSTSSPVKAEDQKAHDLTPIEDL